MGAGAVTGNPIALHHQTIGRLYAGLNATGVLATATDKDGQHPLPFPAGVHSIANWKTASKASAIVGQDWSGHSPARTCRWRVP